MSILRFLILTAASATMIVSGPAAAATTVSIKELKSRSLYNSTTVSGSLDFTPFLTDAVGNNYTVSNLSLSVSAYSPRSLTDYAYLYTRAETRSQQVTSYCWWGVNGICFNTTFYYVYVPVYGLVDKTADAIDLTIGGIVVSDETKYRFDNISNGELFGDLSTTAHVTGDDLDQINSTGVMQISVSGRTNGYIYLNEATATFDLLAVPSAVPEPATWAMMLVGFGMVGGVARYRRRSIQASLA